MCHFRSTAVTLENRGRFVDMLNSIISHIESPEKIHQKMVDLAVRPSSDGT